MKKIFLFLPLLFALACKDKTSTNNEKEHLNQLATQYVRLGLEIGQYDSDFVDAYYGPDSLKPTKPKQLTFPKDSLLASVNSLITELDQMSTNAENDTVRTRAHWLSHQLIAFGRRVKIFSGEYKSFDEESKDLFGAVAPAYPESHFQALVAKLDSLLPGKGTVPVRFQQLASRFIIPKDKIDTVFKVTIAEARKRTQAHYQLPSQETFTLEYVTNKPWSGYNWYKGNYNSNIQINTSLPIYLNRAIDLACHEGYPGHHIYNLLLEKNLYQDKGWVEISLYPLFSPQSLIAEGSANYGIRVAFSEEEQKQFYKNVLIPLTGLDSTNLDLYLKTFAIKSQLEYARNEAARGVVNGKMTDQQALHWLTDYQLLDSKAAETYLGFIKKYRSYVINYNYGQALVKNYIESKGGTDQNPEKRWELFNNLLKNEITTEELTEGVK